jgi:hypothetical protein
LGLSVNINKIGKPISFTTVDGETVEGWLYGVLPRGFPISLDPGGKEIRLIPEDWRGCRALDGPPATFSPPKDAEEKLRDADHFIRPIVEYALKDMNLRPIQNAANRAKDLMAQIRQAERRFGPVDDPGAEPARYMAAKTDQVVEIHTEVYDELERVRFSIAVQEAAERLHAIPGKYLLPAADAPLDAPSLRDTESVLDDVSRWQQNGWTEDRHRRAIDRAFRRRAEVLIAAAISKRPTPKREDKKEDEKSVGAAMRYVAAGVRILGGTALVAANIGISLTAGLASTILTIGATAVQTYVGAVTSIGTGLFAAADGFEKIGGIQKDKAIA